MYEYKAIVKFMELLKSDRYVIINMEAYKGYIFTLGGDNMIISKYKGVLESRNLPIVFNLYGEEEWIVSGFSNWKDAESASN